MNFQALESIARSLVPDGKGILAADESFPTIQKRFDQIDVLSTEETRRDYRQMLFTTTGIEKFISGVILFDETLRQSTQDGKPLTGILEAKGILPGIKVDKGAKSMAGFPMETVTEGLDGLRERLIEYAKLGARFTKWRAVIRIGSNIPTKSNIDANAHALARYAALCQEVELVPIVEPEVLMAGNHDLDKCEIATTAVLKSVFSELYKQRVFLEGVLLKPNMVTPGKDSARKVSVAEVAEATIRCLKRTVPATMPGIVFLSGGQSTSQRYECHRRKPLGIKFFLWKSVATTGSPCLEGEIRQYFRCTKGFLPSSQLQQCGPIWQIFKGYGSKVNGI